MTAVDERRMTDLFEHLDVPEGVRVELLRGEIVMMASPDLVHNRIVTRVLRQIPDQKWDCLQTTDIDILTENSEPVPDLVVLERGVGPESGRLLPAPLVTLLVEVVSKTSVQRDYEIKRSIYAGGEVPAYLIIDPIVGQCVLLTDPVGSGDEAGYRAQRITKFGEPMALDMLGIELDTSEFGTFKGAKPHFRP